MCYLISIKYLAYPFGTFLTFFYCAMVTDKQILKRRPVTYANYKEHWVNKADYLYIV